MNEVSISHDDLFEEKCKIVFYIILVHRLYAQTLVTFCKSEQQLHNLDRMSLKIYILYAGEVTLLLLKVKNIHLCTHAYCDFILPMSHITLIWKLLAPGYFTGKLSKVMCFILFCVILFLFQLAF